MKELTSLHVHLHLHLEFTADHQEQTEDIESITDDPCDVCGGKEKEDNNELVYCGMCEVLVHQGCYYIPDIPDEDWICRPCSEGVQPKCILCNQNKGAMAKTSDGREWAHVQCVWWIPEIRFEDAQRMEKMESLDKIPKERWTMTCCLCKQQEGACIQCCVKGCYKAFHSRCGFENNLLMEMIEEPELVFKPHCRKHSYSSVAENKKTKRRNKKGGPRKRIIYQEGSNIQSESQPKKRKVRDKKTQEITLEEIQSKNDQGDICLHVAAQNSDRIQISSLLGIISKASLNCIDSQNKKGMTPLFISVLRNDSDIVKLFLQHGANPNIFAQATEEQFDAPIHIAASGGDQYLKTITALLADETISLNSFNGAGYTALHLAVMAHGRKISKGENMNSVNIIEKLIATGVDPNLQETNTGRTPLMCAIEKLDITLVEIFVTLIDPKNLQHVLKAESFQGKNVHSIIEESKHVLNQRDYKRLNDLLMNTNEETQSVSSTSS
ncbi:uncharacterized protein LOC127699935 [Mytilus californianus]|uniref:uncharacterized protein LOC127699935 n=1 Tax=Mytilus californianus TaxID=6549 RepID=UPI0022483B97|nr:uncharacterized protein LOC127699935 [Mytilus californianus]